MQIVNYFEICIYQAFSEEEKKKKKNIWQPILVWFQLISYFLQPWRVGWKGGEGLIGCLGMMVGECTIDCKGIMNGEGMISCQGMIRGLSDGW